MMAKLDSDDVDDAKALAALEPKWMSGIKLVACFAVIQVQLLRLSC
jgi:hypothetical protein